MSVKSLAVRPAALDRALKTQARFNPFNRPRVVHVPTLSKSQSIDILAQLQAVPVEVKAVEVAPSFDELFSDVDASVWPQSTEAAPQIEREPIRRARGRYDYNGLGASLRTCVSRGLLCRCCESRPVEFPLADERGFAFPFLDERGNVCSNSAGGYCVKCAPKQEPEEVNPSGSPMSAESFEELCRAADATEAARDAWAFKLVCLNDERNLLRSQLRLNNLEGTEREEAVQRLDTLDIELEGVDAFGLPVLVG